jgi:type II secretion system protein C
MRYVFALLLLTACGGSAPPAEAPKATPEAKAPLAPAAAPDTVPAGAIRRSSLRQVLAQGPGAFLQRVSLDDQAVFASGKFHGFRLARINDADMFKGVDLKPGDVITHVNGFPIEHPEEALQAFNSLEVASELRVEYEREGVAKELRYTIFDDVPAATTPPAPKAPASRTIK